MDPRQSMQRSNGAQSNLQSHLALNTFVDQENARKEQASAQEAAYYERLNAEADKMLGPDRERFDKMVSKMHNSIRNKVAMYGGNRAEFLKNGGRSIMENFTEDIKSTPEFQTYITNKENSVKIKDAMEKGFGHRISMRDKKALEHYEQTGEGNITYSGLMSEIEMPNDNNYDLGKDIPMTDILFNEDNYMKVLGNYMTNFPEDQQPTTEKLLGFMSLMGYGKKGSNRETLRLKQKLAQEKALQATKDVKVKPDTRPQLHTTNLLAMQSHVIKKGTTVNDLFETKTGSFQPKKIMDKLQKSGDTFVSDNVQSDWKHDSYSVTEKKDGFKIHTDDRTSRNISRLWGDRWKPAEAKEVAGPHKDTWAEYFLNREPNERGQYRFDPADIDEIYSSQGIEMTGRNKFEKGEYDTEYENLGVITGLLAKDKNGNNQIVMNIMDDDGEIKAKEQKDHVEALDGSEVKMSYFLALKNSDNERIYYKRVNVEDSAARRGLSVLLGSADDLKKQNEASQRLDSEFQQAEASTAQAEQNFDNVLLTIDSQVENDPNFLNEAQMYSKPDEPSVNRSSIMKSFYAITGAKPNSQEFHKFMETVPQTAKLMRTFGHDTSDEELIDILVSEMNQGASEQDIADNKETGDLWKSTYNRYLQINKE
tara:strand:- start:39731 stop:41680 length:1950 start_codon:yes stop_codon:yes gene_type:complete